MAGTYYQADGGVTLEPKRNTDVFGGGILGGLGLDEYLKTDYRMNSTLNVTPTYNKVVSQVETVSGNNQIVLFAILGAIVILIVKILD